MLDYTVKYFYTAITMISDLNKLLQCEKYYTKASPLIFGYANYHYTPPDLNPLYPPYQPTY
jgi:hypothetical protein